MFIEPTFSFISTVDSIEQRVDKSEISPYELAIRNNDKQSLKLLIADGLILDSDWYHEYHGGTHLGQSPAELCLQYGKLELLQLLAAQPTFALPKVVPFSTSSIDRTWDSLVMCPSSDLISGEYAECERAKGECLEWLLNQNLYAPSLDTLAVEDLLPAGHFPNLLKQALQRELFSVNDINWWADPIWMHIGLYAPVESLEVMIDFIDDLNRNGDDDGETLILRLVRMEYVSDAEIEKIKILVAAGADINKPDYHGNTPLSCARDEKMRRALIELGACNISCSKEAGTNGEPIATNTLHV